MNELNQSMRTRGFKVLLILSTLLLLGIIALGGLFSRVRQLDFSTSEYYELSFGGVIFLITLINAFRALNSFAKREESGAMNLLKSTGQGGEWIVWQKWLSYMIQNLMIFIPIIIFYGIGTYEWDCDWSGGFCVKILVELVFLGGYFLILSLWMSTYPVIYRIVLGILLACILDVLFFILCSLEIMNDFFPGGIYLSLSSMTMDVGKDDIFPVISYFELMVASTFYILFLGWEIGMRLNTSDVKVVKKQRVALLLYALCIGGIYFFYSMKDLIPLGDNAVIMRFGILFAIAFVSELTRKGQMPVEEIYDLAASKKTAYGRLGSLLLLPGWQNLVVLSFIAYLIIVVPSSLATVFSYRWEATMLSAGGIVMWANMLFLVLILRKVITRVGDWGLMLYFGASFVLLQLGIVLIRRAYFSLSDFLPWGNVEGLIRYEQALNPYVLCFVGLVVGIYLVSSAQYWRGFLSRLTPKPDSKR